MTSSIQRVSSGVACARSQRATSTSRTVRRSLVTTSSAIAPNSHAAAISTHGADAEAQRQLGPPRRGDWRRRHGANGASTCRAAAAAPVRGVARRRRRDHAAGDARARVAGRLRRVVVRADVNDERLAGELARAAGEAANATVDRRDAGAVGPQRRQVAGVVLAARRPVRLAARVEVAARAHRVAARAVAFLVDVEAVLLVGLQAGDATADADVAAVGDEPDRAGRGVAARSAAASSRRTTAARAARRSRGRAAKRGSAGRRGEVSCAVSGRGEPIDDIDAARAQRRRAADALSRWRGRPRGRTPTRC